jgi:hypothetical protein
MVGRPTSPHDGGNHDDAAGFGWHHQAGGFSGQAEIGGQVGINDAGPVFVGGLQQRFAGDDSGVVDQDVEAAVVPGDGFEGGLCGGAVRDVEGQGSRQVGERGGSGLQAGGVAAVQDDFGTGFGEALGDGQAEAPGTAGDEGDAVGQGEIGHGRSHTAGRAIVQKAV